MSRDESQPQVEGLDQELLAQGKGSNWSRYRLPVELEGKSFLDVGCWEGVHCAEAVRRGAADVVGVDLCTSGDLVANVERYRFEFLQMDVFGDHWQGLGSFDVVLCSGLLNSVPNPVGLLARLRAVTRELLVLESSVTTLGGEKPVMLFQGAGEDTSDRSRWWAPNRACLEGMLATAGFSGVAAVWEDTRREGFGRACLHAVPSGETDRRRLQPRKPRHMSIRGGDRLDDEAAGRGGGAGRASRADS